MRKIVIEKLKAEPRNDVKIEREIVLEMSHEAREQIEYEK